MQVKYVTELLQYFKSPNWINLNRISELATFFPVIARQELDVEMDIDLRIKLFTHMGNTEHWDILVAWYFGHFAL
jgi:hypothetical protein